MDEGIPSSIQSSLLDFHSAVSDVEEVLGPFFSRPLEEIETNANPLQKAKIELMALFAANSLNWMYLATRGENPSDHPILDELKRIKKYMDRLKELEEREKAPKLNKTAVKNFLRNALWEPKSIGQDATISEPNQTDAVNSNDAYPSNGVMEEELDDVLKRLKEASNRIGQTEVQANQDGESGNRETGMEGSEGKVGGKRARSMGRKNKKTARMDDNPAGRINH